MKKFKLFFILFSLIILFFYPLVIKYNKLIIESIIFSLIPSLFPSLLLINICLEYGCLDDFYNKLKNSSFGRLVYSIILIFICMILGMPSMQNIIKNQCDKGIITTKNKYLMINILNPISFTFIYGLSFSNLQTNIAIKIISIYLSINFFLLLFSNFKIEKVNIEFKQESLNLSQIFINTFKTISLIVSSIMLFSLPLFILELIPFNFHLIIEGLIEFSYPCYLLSKKANIFSNICLLTFFLFPSISIIFQSKIINKDLNIIKYLLTRLSIAIIGIILFLLF